MQKSSKWQSYWDGKSGAAVSDYEFDRGATPRPAALEALSDDEFVQFVEPQPTDVLLDAGCGSGANILRLHDRVQRIVAIDFSHEAVERCRRRVGSCGVGNAEILAGSVTEVPLPDDAVDRVICMSVLHYLDDDEVRAALRQFARVLRPGGQVILHVKNSASLYLSTLRWAKHAKRLLGAQVTLEHIRPFSWYQRELAAAGFVLTDYNAFNVALIEGMPQRLVHCLQGLELAHRHGRLMRAGIVRRHGADLKLKARLG